MNRFRLNRPFTSFDRVRAVVKGELPRAVVATLKRIVTAASKDDGGKGKECGGYINLATWDVYEDPGRPGTGAAVYVPSAKFHKAANVLRFHCHPNADFDTPPSHQDLFELCRDYVKHFDGVFQSLVLAPGGVYSYTIPPRVLFELTKFVMCAMPASDRASPTKRDAAFEASPLAKALKSYLATIKTHQTCRVYGPGCRRDFLRTMASRFHWAITYHPFATAKSFPIVRLRHIDLNGRTHANTFGVPEGRLCDRGGAGGR